MRIARILTGLALCIAAVALPWLLLDQAEGSAASRLKHDLWEYATGQRRTVFIDFPHPTTVAVGDPVFIRDEQTTLRQVGEVRTVAVDNAWLADRQADATRAEILLYPSAPAATEAIEISYQSTPTSLTWVIEKLLSPERRRQIEAEFERLLVDERDEITRALAPLIERNMREVLDVIDDDLSTVLATHRTQLDALGERYYRSVVRQELVPLVKQEIWPTIRTHAEPEVRLMGRELWQRMSLWRFGWRYIYDASPLPERQLTDKEWQRFVEQEALPILERHTPQFIAVVSDVLRALSNSEAVRGALRRTVEQAAADPELRQLVHQIVRESITDNPRVRETIARQWNDPVAKQTLKAVGDRVEPALRRMGDLVFGTRDAGITPEFAAVLRLQILGKDKRWFLISPKEEPNR